MGLQAIDQDVQTLYQAEGGLRIERVFNNEEVY